MGVSMTSADADPNADPNSGAMARPGPQLGRRSWEARCRSGRRTLPRVPWLKRRPGIKLYAPQVILAGRPFAVRVVLECEVPVPVDAVEVELLGTGIWAMGLSHGQPGDAQVFSRWVARPITRRCELTVGSHELTMSFELPADVPASYRGMLFSMEWTLGVHVKIPWWPDARATFVVHVVRSPPSRPAAVPRRVFASSSEGPRPRKPYVEVSLGRTAVVGGERLHGRVALSNTASCQYRALRITLVGVESAPSLLSTFTQHNRMGCWVIPFDAPTEDEPIDFALDVPSGLVPGFRTPTLLLEWFLEVRVDVAWALDTTLWIPIEVHAGSLEGAEGAEVAAPLAVGSQRLALVWAEAARRAGYDYVDGQLTRQLGPCRLAIRREHQGRRGLRLWAEARLAGVEVGLRASEGRLVCRDPGQQQVLEHHTMAPARACPVAQADDARIVCIVDDPGTRIEPVVRLAEGLVALVEAFEAARSVLPAPADMVAMVPSFRAVSRRLGGALCRASMNIRGVRDDVAFALTTQRDDRGALARTVLEVRPPWPIDGRWHQRWDGTDTPGPLPPGLSALVGEADGLIVDAGSIQLVFPPCPDPPLGPSPGPSPGSSPDSSPDRTPDPSPDWVEPHVARLESLLMVTRRLSGRDAGYR